MKKRLFLSTACLALSIGGLALSSTTAEAQQEMGSLTYYQVPASEYQDHYNEWRVFLEYNLKHEPCGHYQEPPAGYVVKGCQVYRVETASNTVTQADTSAAQTQPAPAPAAPAPVLDYTLHFDIDKSKVTASEDAIVSQAVQEIQKDHPASVTVSGYTSTTASRTHNQALSERRAASVARDLESKGVDASIITQKSYGETHLAVPTANNVEMEANRRVVIDISPSDFH